MTKVFYTRLAPKALVLGHVLYVQHINNAIEDTLSRW